MAGPCATHLPVTSAQNCPWHSVSVQWAEAGGKEREGEIEKQVVRLDTETAHGYV
jgi:hypothetical protein